MKNIVKKYTTALWLALATAASGALVGCINDYAPGGADGSQEGMLTLSLLTSDPDTRAAETTPGTAAKDPLNEYLIKNVSLYLYKGKSANLDENTAEPFYSVDVAIDNATTTASNVEVRIPLSKLDAEAKNGNFCIYALANLSNEEREAASKTNKSVSALKAITVDSNFDKVKEKEESFVMDGLSDDIRVGTATNSLTGVIELVRSSAKITLNLNVPETLTVKDGGADVTYTSEKSGIAVWFCNGVKISPVNANAAAKGFKPLAGSIFNSSDLEAVPFAETGSAEYPLVAQMPFYSYPNNWQGSEDNSNRAYMILGVPWTREGETTVQNYYYQVPVNIEKSTGANAATANMLERNKHYMVNLKVGKLGSLSKETPSDVDEKDLHYMIMDWSSEGFRVDLDKLRYLQVERNEYVMDNSTDLSIPYVTSHDVEIVDAKLMFYDYSGTNGTPVPHYISLGAGNESVNYNGTTTPIYSLKINQADKTIDFSHIMWAVTESNNNFSIKKFNNENQEAIGEFVLTFTIHHKDESAVMERITITQYPALYINVIYSPSTEANTTAFINNDKDKSALGNNYVNAGGTNTNFNNYVVNVTRFNTNNTDYIIGDPRELENSWTSAPFSDYSSNWSSGAYLNDGKIVSSTNYFPSDYYRTNISQNYNYYIAPIIRVASSRGVTQPISKVFAHRRCASYQENGRPAGRWRIPTYGEVKFMMELTAKGLIPRLFGNDNSGTTTYWVASGKAEVSNGTSSYAVKFLSDNENTTFVRCVYDEWYWGNDTIPQVDKNKFTWGDRARK